MEVDTAIQDFTISVPTRLKLVVTEGPCEGQSFDTASINSAHLTVGRTKKSKIHFKDSSISEKHAELSWDGRSGAWTLRDTDSSNGTRLNGDGLQPYHAHTLKTGDSITFGDSTVVSVEVLEQALCEMNVETVLRAHLESAFQSLEGSAITAALDKMRRSHEALDALLASPGANQAQAVS